MKKVGIIGGGPAGLIAAIAALRQNADVNILEHKDRVGKKLLVTGRGRCNLTNQNLSPKMYFCRQKDFVRTALSQFDLKKTIEFFHSIGVSVFQDASGKYFPFSEEASAVLDCLRNEIHCLGGKETTAVKIKSISKDKSFMVHTESALMKFDALILATGGKSYPSLGSDGSGYQLAKAFGHSIVPPRPSLVQMESNESFLKSLAGYKFIGKACLNDSKRNFACFKGEILFTDYGLSGIPVLQLSRQVHQALEHGKKLFLTLDLLPSMEKEQIEKEICFRQTLKNRTLKESLVGFLHKRLIPILLKKAQLSPDSRQISKREIQTLARLLKSWEIRITGTRGWKQAQVTAGGIQTREIDPLRMESKFVSKLFFAGEILDVDGLSGGYNLQWAWTSGFIAGSAAGEQYDSNL